MKGINELISLVQSLQKELSYQNVEIKQVQGLIESCSACQAVDVNRNSCQVPASKVSEDSTNFDKFTFDF